MIAVPPLGRWTLAMVAVAHAAALTFAASGDPTRAGGPPPAQRFTLSMSVVEPESALAEPTAPPPLASAEPDTSVITTTAEVAEPVAAMSAETVPVPAEVAAATPPPPPKTPEPVEAPPKPGKLSALSAPPRPKPKAPPAAPAPASKPAPAATEVAAEPASVNPSPVQGNGAGPNGAATETGSSGAGGGLVPPLFGAGYLDNPRPAYPHVSRRLGEQGRVWLLVKVDAQGRPESVTVDQTSGHSRLDKAAVNAVRGWRFVPARRAGTATAADVRVPINFSLEDYR